MWTSVEYMFLRSTAQGCKDLQISLFHLLPVETHWYRQLRFADKFQIRVTSDIENPKTFTLPLYLVWNITWRLGVIQVFSYEWLNVELIKVFISVKDDTVQTEKAHNFLETLLNIFHYFHMGLWKQLRT